MAAFVYIVMTRGPAKVHHTYVGWTLDLDRRLEEHNGKAGRGAKSTRGRSWVLVYAEKHRTRRGAMKREYALKRDRAFRAALRAQ